MMMSDSSVLADLYRAKAVRPVYENSSLPIEDFYTVGGKLSQLIRRAEALLQSTIHDEIRRIIAERLADVKSFYSFVLSRIRGQAA